MHLSTAILGKNIVDKLEERQRSALLVIGSDTFTRPQLSKFGCFNFAAAARLSHLITAELKIKNTRELFEKIPPAHLAIPGLGAICLATIGCAFEIKKLGTLADYVAKHAKGAALVTFATMKNNVLDKAAEREERKRSKARAHGRLNKATRIKGDRHIARSGSKLTLAKAS